jgi:hypothetical protein
MKSDPDVVQWKRWAGVHINKTARFRSSQNQNPMTAVNISELNATVQ